MPAPLVRSTILSCLALGTCGPLAPAASSEGSSDHTITPADTTNVPPAHTDSTTSPTSSSSTSSEDSSVTDLSTTSESSTSGQLSGDTETETSSGEVGSSTGDDTGGVESPCNGLVTFKVEVDPNLGTWLILDSPDDKAALAGIECLEGDLVLFPGVGDATGLGALRVITGMLMVTSEDFGLHVAPFEGLDNLERVGNLSLFLANVSTLAGLESLHTIDGGIGVNQSILKDVHGLEGLQTVGGPVQLGNCWWNAGSEEKSDIKLVSLAGFESLTTIDQELHIASSMLTDLTIPGLESVGMLRVCAAESLVGVNLPSLTTAASIQFDHYTAYPQLSAFDLPKLKHIGEQLSLRSTQLTDLGGLAALESIGTSLHLVDNKQLPTCTAEAFATEVAIGGDIVISNNLADQCGP